MQISQILQIQHPVELLLISGSFILYQNFSTVVDFLDRYLISEGWDF